MMMQRYKNIIKSNLFELCRAIAKSTKSKAEYLMRGALPSATLGPEVSEATEGVDKSLNSHPLTVKEQFSVCFTFQICFLWKLSGRAVPAGNHGS